MHPGAKDYVKAVIIPCRTVLEIGSLDINGGIRDILPMADWYGIDIADGPGVDEVAHGVTYSHPEPVDLAICCEVFEHTPDWASIILNMSRNLKKGGQMIVTAAGPGRPEHSAITGGLGLLEGEWYENIDPHRLAAVMTEAGIEGSVRVRADDVYASGIKT
jgi:SAM-dependent methyltransferase